MRIGGIEIDVPKPILSNKFDCPYATDARCEIWPGWRFGKGKQKMDGRRALIYSRIRKNQLDAADNDLTRAGRQQAVIEAMTGKLAGPGTFMRLPFIGDDLAKPLTTDLSAGQLMQLGWVKFRANGGRALHCRLGGEPSSYRRPVGDHRRRGEHGRALDVHRPLRPAAPSARHDLRRGLHRRQLVSRSPLVGGRGLLLAAVRLLLRRAGVAAAAVLRALASCARRARSPSSRNPSP